jgi:hypothetical protein
MTILDKKHILDLLSESHTTNLALFEGSNLEVSVHENSDWQIRDIIWHITIWDRQVTKSIRAYKAGGEYAISAFNEDEYNKRGFEEGRKLTEEQVIEDYKQAREDFEISVKELPSEKFSDDMLYPWGDEQGDISQLVKYMVEHDGEHRDEIAAALAT